MLHRSPTTDERLQIEDFFADQYRGSTTRGMRQYAAGMGLVVLHDGQWVEADVVAPPDTNWKCDHKLRLIGARPDTSPGAGVITLRLHPFNHAPRILSLAKYEQVRARHAGAMRTQHSTVADALSGKRLDVQKQMVPIGMSLSGGVEAAESFHASVKSRSPSASFKKASPTPSFKKRSPTLSRRAPTLSRMTTGGVAHGIARMRWQSALQRHSVLQRQDTLQRQSTRSFVQTKAEAAFRAVDGVAALSEWFDESHRVRVARPEAASATCVLITANPAAGKTCLMSQLVIESISKQSGASPAPHTAPTSAMRACLRAFLHHLWLLVPWPP